MSSYVPSYLLAPLAAPGALPLINRLVLAPLTRGRAGPSRVPNAIMGEYYRQRAGFGLVVTEVRSGCVRALCPRRAAARSALLLPRDPPRLPCIEQPSNPPPPPASSRMAHPVLLPV